MPMLKKLPKIAPSQELKMGPTDALVNSILNFSKSLEVKNIQSKKVLIHMN